MDERPPLDHGDSDRSFVPGSEAAFTSTPINHQYEDESSAPKQDVGRSFIQQQLSFQRSSSAAKEHASAISRSLSVKSNKSGNANESRGRERSNSNSSLLETTSNNCSLSKSSSERSTKSVKSMHAVGSYPLGTLHLHSPSPTRASNHDYGHDLLKSGDVIIMSNIPAGSLLGVDTKAFDIQKQDQFDGIRDIPAGAHFVWGGSSQGSLRNGFWFMSSRRATDENGEVYVLRWDSYNEVIVEEISTAEIRIQKENLAEVFDKLKAYDFAGSDSPMSQSTLIRHSATFHQELATQIKIWTRLTSCIKGALISKATGQTWNHWQVSSSHDLKPPPGQTTGVDDKDNVLAFVFPRASRTFSSISVGRERTEQAQDTTSHVNAVISGNCSYEDSDEIIGELQFCYLTGMILGNLACIEQWAHIVKIVFKAYRLALDDPEFFVKFIDAVHAQFIYDEEGIEGSIMDQDPTLEDDLRMILTIFKSRLNELLLAKGANLTPAQTKVGKAFESLEEFLWKWDWDLRGNYLRSGKIQLEDGETIDASLTDFEAEDERGHGQGHNLYNGSSAATATATTEQSAKKEKEKVKNNRSRHGSLGGVRWKF